MDLSLDIPHKLRKLGTSISNHVPLTCASSISFLVGATRSWRVKLKASSNKVPSTLITTCVKPLILLTMAQSPWYNSTTSSNVVPKCNQAQVAKEKLIRNTQNAIMKQLQRITPRRVFQWRHVFARECSGLTLGNHDSIIFTEAYLSDTEFIDEVFSSKAVEGQQGEWTQLCKVRSVWNNIKAVEVCNVRVRINIIWMKKRCWSVNVVLVWLKFSRSHSLVRWKIVVKKTNSYLSAFQDELPLSKAIELKVVWIRKEWSTPTQFIEGRCIIYGRKNKKQKGTVLSSDRGCLKMVLRSFQNHVETPFIARKVFCSLQCS